MDAETTDLPAGSTDPVARWQRQLRDRVGVGDQERAQMLKGLDTFCERHRTTPAQLLTQWHSYPELNARRDVRSTTTPDRNAESFLVHNGVNVFGDLVCVPTTPERPGSAEG